MAGDRILRVVLTGDAKKLIESLALSEESAGRFGSKFGALGPVMAGAAVVGTAAVAGIGVALLDIGQQFESAYHKIEVGTGATGAALEALKTDFKQVVSDVPASFGDASTALTAVSAQLGDSGPKVQGLTEQFLELSRITKTDLTTNMNDGLAVLKNWGIEGADMGPAMDSIFRASQLTGVGFATLSQEMADSGLVLRGLGFTFEQSTALMGTLGQAGVDVGAAMPALKKTLAAAFKDGVDGGKLLTDTLTGIQTGAAGADAAAIKLFGAKGGSQMIELAKEGKLNFQDLQDAIGSSSGTILEAGKNAMTFGDKFELIKNRVFVALEPLAMKVVDGIGKAMDELGPYITELSKWFADELPGAFRTLQPWVDRFSTVLVALGGFIQTRVIPGIVMLTKFLKDHDEVLKAAAIVIGLVLLPAFVSWALAAGTAAVATVAAAAPVIALGVALVALVAGIIWVVENFGIFQDAASTAFEFVKGVVSGAVDWIKQNWDLLLAILTGPIGIAVDIIYRHFDDIVSFITGLPGRIADAAVGMWDGIVEEFKAAINGVIGAWNSFGIPSFHVHITMPSVIPNIDFDTPSIDFPNIPYLAKGGIATVPMLAVIGDNPSHREAIVPLEKAGEMGFGGGGDHYHFHNHGVIGSQAELERWVYATLEGGASKGRRLGPNARKALTS